jgi:spore germination cell wall hydrolase CwlJ-like protein
MLWYLAIVERKKSRSLPAKQSKAPQNKLKQKRSKKEAIRNDDPTKKKIKKNKKNRAHDMSVKSHFTPKTMQEPANEPTSNAFPDPQSKPITFFRQTKKSLTPSTP